ncbi:MAG: acyl-CoA dehydrogenase family protein [Candidatus Tectomicrobia bacterium]|uniref:Acyl-CoA dehydrogenase family protein n=1 Tax=Tectimicrobiota bacterium TaxID=2528274 RepID=A0A933GME3_UNCTE|nr:acyl-CoA dehydrogenase family protein [Candidatus Tectomicrobia bacterium]
MDFDFTDEERMIQKAAGDFARKEIAPKIAEFDRGECYDPEIFKKMGELGFTGGVLPKKYDGSEMSYVGLALMIEEIARYCVFSAVLAGYASCSGGQGTLKYGTEEQKLKYLAALCRGEKPCATGVTEPHSGTDIVRVMETTVKKDGDFYIVNGTKAWISNLEHAQWFITFAQMDKSRGHRGICAFIIEKDWPGVTATPYKNLMGDRYFKTGELVFEDVRVPKENLVGKELEGYKVLMCGTEIGRLACAARSLGQIRACLEESVSYAKQRVVFGRPIAEYQLIKAKIADMALGLEAGRFLTYHLAWMKDKGMEGVQKEASMAKLYTSDVLMKSATEAVQIHGAYGIHDEYNVGRYFRDAKVTQIYDGTQEIHRVIIGDHTLGFKQRYRGEE